ncbi:uracil phosphoribosyltransferase [Acanthamoeba castellanii str. Neff]|uniref:uracil phosphoribosyltransferase n=1 Tax=Acanthamoeba castellanii (strain ATCC 30010 / Neff) TaxID=1257118 RepID=L8GRJ2_ACACF|nr:uracil phosphoribosyltransferase [Acanthamoeba castellanii str. Neff]ELR15789.1 uracil phosphoribosyltransferase [Acanthamoeba castellanii str. Neff]
MELFEASPQYASPKPGFDYRPPTPRVFVMPPSYQVKGLHTIIRDRNTSNEDFVFYSNRLIRLLVEEGLNHLPFVDKVINTPTGDAYRGVEWPSRLCGVSVVRAGESMESALKAVAKDVRIGKILIERNEDTGEPELYFVKLPEDINNRFVLLLDPILASGGGAKRAIQVLLDHGVKEEKILFLTLIAVCAAYPEVGIVVSEVDPGLNEKVTPGIGDFADRYFCTED